MEIKSLIDLIDWKWINALTDQKVEHLFYKGDDDWTTEIDLSIEKHLLWAIETFSPNSEIVSEEAFETQDATEIGIPSDIQPQIKWFVDPLDGTYNLTLGLPYFGIQLCCWDLIVDEPLLGLIYIPRLGELVAWDKTMTHGTFHIWNREAGKFETASSPIGAVSRPLSRALIGFGDFSSSNKASRPYQGRLIQSLSSTVGKIRLHGASSIDFHFLCSGRSQAYILFTKRAWEIYPGLAVAKGFDLHYEQMAIDTVDYQGPLWLIAHKTIFEDLKAMIQAL